MLSQGTQLGDEESALGPAGQTESAGVAEPTGVSHGGQWGPGGSRGTQVVSAWLCMRWEGTHLLRGPRVGTLRVLSASGLRSPWYSWDFSSHCGTGPTGRKRLGLQEAPPLAGKAHVTHRPCRGQWSGSPASVNVTSSYALL